MEIGYKFPHLFPDFYERRDVFAGKRLPENPSLTFSRLMFDRESPPHELFNSATRSLNLLKCKLNINPNLSYPVEIILTTTGNSGDLSLLGVKVVKRHGREVFVRDYSFLVPFGEHPRSLRINNMWNKGQETIIIQSALVGVILSRFPSRSKPGRFEYCCKPFFED